MDLHFVANDGTRAAIADGLAGYVLPGQHKRWPIPPALVRADGTFKATINGEPLAQSLALEAQAP